jgi:hypothetical protein
MDKAATAQVVFFGICVFACGYIAFGGYIADAVNAYINAFGHEIL